MRTVMNKMTIWDRTETPSYRQMTIIPTKPHQENFLHFLQKKNNNRKLANTTLAAITRKIIHKDDKKRNSPQIQQARTRPPSQL